METAKKTALRKKLPRLQRLMMSQQARPKVSREGLNLDQAAQGR
jgi:hypothetical protein